MPAPVIFISTWGTGVFRVTGTTIAQELAGQPVCSLVDDGRGGILGIVGGHSLHRRQPAGEWTPIAQSDFELSCCVPVGNAVFAGTADARVLRTEPDGSLHDLRGFDAVPGRTTWYAGTAIVNGEVVGPPLGIRSIAATCDGAVLLANVHVGGIPRSTDGGRTWEPTIDVESDVHQVCAHPTRPDIVIAATASGLAVSHDAGRTWTIEREGLHAPYCSAVAFVCDDIYVAASSDHFTNQGAVYHRPIDSDAPLKRLAGGMPQWIDGIADTGCISARGAAAAIIDRSGCLYVSHDGGESWMCQATAAASASGLHIR